MIVSNLLPLMPSILASAYKMQLFLFFPTARGIFKQVACKSKSQLNLFFLYSAPPILSSSEPTFRIQLCKISSTPISGLTCIL